MSVVIILGINLIMHDDINLFIMINSYFNSEFYSVFFSIATHLGNGVFQAVLIIPLMYFFDRKKFKKNIIALVITAAFGGLVVSGIKIVVKRERPPAYFKNSDSIINTPLGIPHDYSFPSGHTQTAFSTAAYLSFLYPLFSPLFMLGALLAGISRIALGVHFPLDVFAGALLGIITGTVGFVINKRRIKKNNILN